MKRFVFIMLLPLVLTSCGGDSPASQTPASPSAPQELQWDNTNWDQGDWG